MAEKTIEERLDELKQKRDHVGDLFGAADLQTLVEAIEYAMSHGGDVSVAVTPVENGYKITVTDSEGNVQAAVVENGGDAYEVYKSTVPSGQEPMSKAEWLASLKGEKGNDGHNPCLGVFADASSLPTTDVQEGDYAYADVSEVSHIFRYNGSAWVDNGEGSPDNQPAFDGGAGPTVAGTKIDDTQLANPATNALAKAEDAMQLAVKLDGVTANKKISTYTPISGYKVQGDGALSINENASYATIYLGDATSVEFEGVNLNSSSTSGTKNAGYCFGHYDGEELEENWVIDEAYHYDAESDHSVLQPYHKEIPQGSTHLRTNVTYSVLVSGAFYCYTHNGKTVVDLIPQIVDNCNTDDATKALSANQGLMLKKEISNINFEIERYESIEDFVDNVGNIPVSIENYSSSEPYNTYRHVSIFVAGADYVEFETKIDTRICFASRHNAYPGKGIYKIGDTISVEADKKYVIDVPEGAVVMNINLLGDTKTDENIPKYVNVYRKKTVEDTLSPYYTNIMLGGSGDNINLGPYGNRSTVFFKTSADKVYRVRCTGTISNLGIVNMQRLPKEGIDFEILRTITSSPFSINVSDYNGFVLVTANTGIENLEIAASSKTSLEGEKESAIIKDLTTMLSFDDVSADPTNGSINRSNSNYGGGVYRSSSSYKSIKLALHGERFIKVTADNSTNTFIAFLESLPTEAVSIPSYAEDYELHHLVYAGETSVISIPESANYALINCPNNTPPSYIGLSSGSVKAISSTMNEYKEQMLGDKLAVAQASQTMGQVAATYNIANRDTQPSTKQQKNIIDRCNRMIGTSGPHISGTEGNITWTPKFIVPGKKSDYAKNVLQTWGIPYSSNVNDYKEVGINVSVYTFMTAIDNPYSLMYTERVYEAQYKSAWGRKYSNVNGFAYYGSVCCGFSSGVLSLPIKYGNTTHKRYAELYGVFVPLAAAGEVNWDFMQIGDIFDDSKHSFVIYDITRDANGNVSKVLTAECTSTASDKIGGCRHREYTKATLQNRMKEHGSFGPYIHYRVAEMYKAKGVSDDDAQDFSQKVYNKAISTIYGDKASVAEGDLMVINYNLYGTQEYEWTGINIEKYTFSYYHILLNEPSDWEQRWVDYYEYKNGELEKLFIEDGDEEPGAAPSFEANKYYKYDTSYREEAWLPIRLYTLAEAEQSLTDFYNNDGDTITPNPFNTDIDQTGHALVLGYDFASGVYRACMTDGSNNSDYVQWEVLPNDFTVTSNEDGSYTIINNTEYEWVYLTVGDRVNGDYKAMGVSYVGRPISYYENKNKQLRLFVDEMKTVYGVSTECTHLKIMLRGKYGITASLPIELPTE